MLLYEHFRFHYRELANASLLHANDAKYLCRKKIRRFQKECTTPALARRGQR